MTLEETKKILESEGFKPEIFLGVLVEDVKAASWEKIEVSEAMKVVAENGYFPFMEKSKYEERKARLKKEYEQNTKAPGSAANRIKEDSDVNPALAESATQFNDALLDEQAKKIAELTKDKELMKKATLSQLDDFIEIYNLLTKESQKTKRLGKEIAKLNGIIHKKNLKIEELGKESSRHLEGKMKMFGENFDLEQMLKDKNAVLSDVAEELRLSKIREKNLTELCQKYIKANEELKEKLADKVVDKIDAQVLKSAESALAYKEKVIADLKEKLKSIYKNRHIERVYKKKLVEKDEVIDNLHKELKAQKGLKDEVSLKYIGVKHNLKLRMDECEKLKKELDEAKKQNTAVMVDMTAKCLGAARESINDVFESYAAKYAKSTLDELKEKAYNSFNAKAHNLGLVGSKDGNGITDQMEEEKKLSPFRDDSVGAVTNQKDCSPIKDTHPTEDNPEEVEMDEILEFVRKAMEEGHTVSIDYDKAEEGGDQSATIVECGKDIDDVFKEIKRLCQE